MLQCLLIQFTWLQYSICRETNYDIDLCKDLSPNVVESCEDSIPNWLSMTSKDCSWFEEMPSRCIDAYYYYDWNFYTAKDVCCVCEGGVITYDNPNEEETFSFACENNPFEPTTSFADGSGKKVSLMTFMTIVSMTLLFI